MRQIRDTVDWKRPARRQRTVRLPVRTGQGDPRPQRQRLRGFPPPCPCLQRPALVSGELDGTRHFSGPGPWSGPRCAGLGRPGVSAGAWPANCPGLLLARAPAIPSAGQPGSHRRAVAATSHHHPPATIKMTVIGSYAPEDEQRVSTGRPAAMSAAVETFRLIGSHGFAFDEEYVRDLAAGAGTAGTTRPVSGGSSQRARASPTAPRRCAASRSRHWSSTGCMTRWSRRAGAWRSPRRSRTPGSRGSPAWATTCPGTVAGVRQADRGADRAGRTAPAPEAASGLAGGRVHRDRWPATAP